MERSYELQRNGVRFGDVRYTTAREAVRIAFGLLKTFRHVPDLTLVEVVKSFNGHEWVTMTIRPIRTFSLRERRAYWVTKLI